MSKSALLGQNASTHEYEFNKFTLTPLLCICYRNNNPSANALTRGISYKGKKLHFLDGVYS